MREYQKATMHVCDFVEDIIGDDGEIDYPESTFADSVLGLSTYIKARNKKSKGFEFAGENPPTVPYYEVHPTISPVLVTLAETDEEFFDYCTEICALNILADAPLPYPMRNFAYRVLSGQKTRPSRRARPRKKNWMMKSMLWSLTLEIVQDFGLSLTRNDASARFSACDAVAEALTVCGRKTNYSEIKNLMVHPDNARLRAEFEASRNIMRRWWQVEPPKNALSPEYYDFWMEAAEADVLDILKVFSTPRK